MPSKEETATGYQGSKDEFLKHRSKIAREIERETEEVDDEVRHCEVLRLVTEVLAEVVGHLLTGTQTTIILTMTRRMMTTPLLTRVLLSSTATRTSPSPRT